MKRNVVAGTLLAALLLTVLLVAAPAVFAQSQGAPSLGDVARQQRTDPVRPHAAHVITNEDLEGGTALVPRAQSAEQPAGSAGPTGGNAGQTSATAPRPNNTAARTAQQTSNNATALNNAEKAQLQKRASELNRQMQSLQSEINDLEKQRTELRAGNIYGDPNRLQKNEEIRQLSDQIDAKKAQFTTMRAEMADIAERVARTSVIQ
jgi:molecular chaperone GrpE (heat shock protein)